VSTAVHGHKYLRDCAVCGAAIYARPHQDDSARTCKPTCAKELAMREHPEINVVDARGSGSSGLSDEKLDLIFSKRGES
jgi:hypothetical protein